LVHSFAWGDKLGHIFLFGLLTLLLIVASKFKAFKFNGLNIYCAVAIVLIFVVCEEISQAFIASRTFDLLDLGADIVGIAIATTICAWIEPNLKDNSDES